MRLRIDPYLMKKIIILDRCSENILEIVQDITDENLEDTIILNCGVLRKGQN